MKNKIKQKRDSVATLIYSILAIIIIGGIVYFSMGILGAFGDKSNKSVEVLSTYKTIDKSQLHEEANANSKIIAKLKSGTLLSGNIIGKKDGIDWVEVSAIDGSHGFVPLDELALISDDADLSQIKFGNYRIITSSTINMRSKPSLSGNILGIIDGGTPLTSDGTIVSQGEKWFRLRLENDLTAYIMARFTAPDEEKIGAESVKPGSIGVLGIVNKIANIQATPFADSRVIRTLDIGNEISILGQTNSDIWYYIVRTSDGTQGFVEKTAINIPQTQSHWEYPDGTIALGPNIPKPKTTSAVNVRANNSNNNISIQSAPKPKIIDMSGTENETTPTENIDSNPIQTNEEAQAPN